MNDDILNDPTIDWASCTFDGARLKNHRDFCAMTFAKKLEVNEGLCDLVRHFLEYRKKNGLPYIDPYTDQLVRPTARNDLD